MGHESVLMTLRSYGHIAPERQEEIMNALSRTERKNWTDQWTTEIAVTVAAIISDRIREA